MDLSFFDGEEVFIVRKTFTGDFNPKTREPVFVVQEIPVEGVFAPTGLDLDKKPFENVYETLMTLILPYGTVLVDGDYFKIRGEYWESDSRQKPLNNFSRYDRFLKPPVTVNVIQRKGLVDNV